MSGLAARHAALAAHKPPLKALLTLVHIWCGVMGLWVTITALGMWNLGEFQKKTWLGPGADLMPLGEYLATVFFLTAVCALPAAIAYIGATFRKWNV